jgi:hypothetical protein
LIIGSDLDVADIDAVSSRWIAIDPPMLKSVPGCPELVSVMVAGAVGVNRIVLPFAEFTKSDCAMKICTTPLFDPWTLKMAGRTVPVQVAALGR